MKPLSEKEKPLYELIQQVGSLSGEQAMSILIRNGCTEKQARHIVLEFSNQGLVHLIKNDADDILHILAGGLKSNFREKVEWKTEACMYIALDVIKDNEAIGWIRKNQGGADISFISDNWVHQIISLSSRDLHKINILQQDYNSVVKDNKKRGYRCHTYFVFPSTEDEDAILDRLEEMDITMPHSIVFLKSDDMTTKPEYTLYNSEE